MLQPPASQTGRDEGADKPGVGNVVADAAIRAQKVGLHTLNYGGAFRLGKHDKGNDARDNYEEGEKQFQEGGKCQAALCFAQ